MRLDGATLVSFCAVAEELSFARAAERLCTSQPPLSRRIRQFEERIGAALFVRTTRSVRLTPTGALVYEHASKICADMDYMLTCVRELAQGEDGRFSIGITPSAAHSPLVEALYEFRCAHPKAAFEVREMDSVQMRKELLLGEMDVALMRPVAADDGIEMSVVHSEALGFIVRSEDAFPGACITPTQLARQNLIGYDPEQSPYLHALCEDLFKQLPNRPAIVQQSRLPSIITLVEAGAGAAIVPWSMVNRTRSALRFYEIDGILSPIAQVVVACLRSSHNATAQLFVAQLLAKGKA